MVNINIDSKTMGIALVFLIIGIGVGYFVFGGTSGVTGMIISEQEASQKTIDFIVENFEPQAELMGVEMNNGLYEVAVDIGGQIIPIYVTTNGKFMIFANGLVDMDTFVAPETPSDELESTGIEGSFNMYDEELCTEGGKPLIMLFSTTWCGHCEWVKEIFDSTVKSYGDDIAAYHWELDTGDNTITEEVETEVPEELNVYYEKYNPGGSIPTFIFGCKYSRVGNGHESEDDLDAEEAEFRVIIDKLLPE